MSDTEQLAVEVVYGDADYQKLISLKVPNETTVWDAVVQSGITTFFPELDLSVATMGIFSRIVANPKQQLIRDADRVEIYRPLMVDPMEARRARAAKVQTQRKR